MKDHLSQNRDPKLPGEGKGHTGRTPDHGPKIKKQF